MRFAFLGADAQTLEVAHHLAIDAKHDLTLGCEVGPAAAQMRAWAPELKIAPHWEILVGGAEADVVVVARSDNDDERAEQLRKLVQGGTPLVISQPVNSSMLIYYELDMIRRETGCVMLPYVADRWHPGLARLQAILRREAGSDIGEISQVVFERTLADRSRGAVEAQFARDSAVVRALCGDLTSISAMGPPGDATAVYANLGVQLAGPGGRLVRWSVGPVEQSAGARLTLVGAEGKATLQLPAPGEPSELETVRGGNREITPIARWSPPAAAIEQLELAVAGKPAAPTWPDGCRDIELTESIARSLAKGRTIELHNEEHSEHGTFKGTMTSLGCGLLWLSLLVFILALVLAWATGAEVFRYAPHFILAVLALFLAIQSLKLVFRNDE